MFALTAWMCAIRVELFDAITRFMQPIYRSVFVLRDVSHEEMIGFSSRPSRRRAVALIGLVTTLALALGLAMTPTATAANSYTIYHFDLYTTTTTYPGGPYTHSDCTYCEKFRWSVDTPHSTRVSINWCTDYSFFDSADISAHNQNWHTFTNDIGWFEGDCLRFRGRSLYSTQYNRNGFLEV
jgi:hypothetical protein